MVYLEILKSALARWQPVCLITCNESLVAQLSHDGRATALPSLISSQLSQLVPALDHVTCLLLLSPVVAPHVVTRQLVTALLGKRCGAVRHVEDLEAGLLLGLVSLQRLARVAHHARPALHRQLLGQLLPAAVDVPRSLVASLLRVERFLSARATLIAHSLSRVLLITRNQQNLLYLNSHILELRLLFL